MKLTKKRLMENAGLSYTDSRGYFHKELTAQQKQGEFIIGSDIAQDDYDYDEEALVDDLTRYKFKEAGDYELVIARGDDFPNAIKITPQALSRILANQEMISFLLGLEGNGQY